MYRIHISHEGVVYTKKDVFLKFESKDSVHIRLGRTSTPASRLQEPSTEPVVPISANINAMTCSGVLRMRLQISVTFAKIVFLFPSRWMDGGAIEYFLPVEESREGF